MSKELTVVGKLGKPHGIGGAFRFTLSRALKNKRKLPRHFIIEERGSALPWFIAEIKWNGAMEGFVRFEEIDSPESAKRLAGSDLLLKEDEASSLFREERSDYDELLGFTVFNEDKTELGIVEEVATDSGQVLMRVIGEAREYTIPFVDEFVLELNKHKKQMMLSLPDGLLDL